MYRRHIGKYELGQRAAIALAVDDSAAAGDIKSAHEQGVDIVEYRVDQFSTQEPGEAAEIIGALPDIPALVTVRSAREGGQWQLGEDARADMYRALLPVAGAIDCELESDICSDVTAEAHTKEVLVIGSFHDFKKCPRESKLQDLADHSLDLGVDVLKVATLCEDWDDTRRLAKFTLEQADRGAIVIGMGQLGVTSRVFFAALGSMLMYTFLGNPTAPGQLNCADTIHYRSVFYGE